MRVLNELEPRPLWAHFQTLCDFPRPSKHETALRDHLRAWAEARGLATRLDAVGNLLICKPATPGMADRETVVLQGHLDMVTQKNAGTEHDFLRDPIRPLIGDDGWVRAEGTTLGADNGIGVAAALAVLESDDLPHPAIEALFTLDEEAGMTGAQGLGTDLLTGRLLLNLDTEDWGEFYVGCAGGIDVLLERSLDSEALPADREALRVELTGLRGGHSGVDIHLERGNATRLLGRVLAALAAEHDARLVSLEGGTLRNALPREAFAVIAVPAAQRAAVAATLDQWQALLRDELAGVDDGVTLVLREAQAARMLDTTASAAVMDLVNALPHGVARWSQRVPGVVETSNNIGVVRAGEDGFSAVLLVRSLLDSGLAARVGEIVAVGRLGGCRTATEGRYPGWTPNPDSPLLALGLDVYRRHFGGEAAVKVIHAGLECGILAGKYPGLDMLSFGPNVRGAHSPDERVEIASVAMFWQLLAALLAATPVRHM